MNYGDRYLNSAAASATGETPHGDREATGRAAACGKGYACPFFEVEYLSPFSKSKGADR